MKFNTSIEQTVTLEKINMDSGAQKLENKHGLWNSRIYWGILGSGVWEPSQIHAWQSW